MQPNPEIIKQTEKQIAIELAGSGKLSTRTLLKIIDLSSVNVDREMQQIAKEQGSEQIIELIDKYPEIQGQIMQMVQQIEQSGNAK
jgi:predicted RNA-binding protein with PIN domain